MADFPPDFVRLGRITGAHGVRGWVRVHSFTEPRENIVGYARWTLAAGGALLEVAVEDGRLHGRTVVAKLAGMDDRDAAQAWAGAEVGVPRAALPALPPGEYYWRDLEGLAVETTDGEALGRVDHLVETGAHDVLALDAEGRRLIPFVPGEVVREVDLERGRILVDWASDYWD